MTGPSSALRRDEPLVLCYHAVSPGWPADLSVTPEAFERQIAHLAEKGFAGTTFSAATAGVEGGAKVVAVTFDDGYRSVLEWALPILDRHEMPGTLFVPTDFVGSERMSWPGIDQWIGTPHEAELKALSWEEARELRAAGWEIGSHTQSHPRLTRLSDAALETELVESRRVCAEMLGAPCTSIAFPYGDFDARVIAAAGRAGYEAGATLPHAFSHEGRLDWPRAGVYHGDSQRVFRWKISPLTRRARRLGVFAGLLRARLRILG